MSEFKIHHLIEELLKVFGSKASPEEFIEILQKNKNDNAGSCLPHVLQSEINTIAKNSSNPRLFLDKYEELKLKNVDCLGPFVQLLHKISEDNNLKSFLTKTDKTSKTIKKSKTAAEMTPDDLPSVLDRLLKAVKKSTNPPQSTVDVTSKSQMSSIHITPSVMSWVQKRPNMSWDFTLTPSCLGNLGKIPACSQENILIEDLLNVLSGLDGCYIESKPLLDPYGPREFIVSDSVDVSLSELVKQILPLASHYSMMQRFVEEKMQFEYGQVNNALCAAIQTLLIDYSLFICQIETEFRNGTLNLHKMWFYIQQNMHAMGIVAGITATISKADARGGKVLSLLHEQTLGSIGDSKAQDLCLSLTQAATVPYMNILETWIYKGVISDPLKEFLVEDNEIIQRENLSVEDYSADYWAKRYTVRRERIPKFLERVADIILRAGKYLNVIRQCGKTISSKSEHIVYKIEEREYVETIEKAYLFASKTLLELLMKENDLMGRLRSVKHYFLLDQGDFILQFLNLCEKELSKNVNQVLLARLESFLEIALRMSSANSDPYKEDMGTILMNYDLRSQMFKILSIQTDDEQEYRSKKEKRQLTGLESFTFDYKVQWPVSLILNHRAVACYQMIFRHLFYCKYIERMLCQIWRTNRTAKKLCSNSSSQYRAAFALRQRMLHYVQNLEYHMMVEVIEPNWNRFLQRIAKVSANCYNM
ncbi:Gamma-tubulin ring protein 84 [Carabus blaptoides fortunei]